MRGSSKHPRAEPFGVAPPHPSSVDLAANDDVPPLSTSSDSDIRRMLETVMTIQAAHGQILVDMLDELRTLRVDLEHLRRSTPPLPFDDGL